MFFPLLPFAAGMIGCSAYYSPLAWRLYCVNVLRKQAARNRIVALTYDDGPSDLVTPAILQLLACHKARATFFMLGRNAQQNIDIADRIVEEGHDAACHTDQHLNAWKVVPSRAVADINAGYHRLSRWVAPNGMFRPPYGKMILPTQLAIRRRGSRIGWWTIDSGDTAASLPQPKQVAESLMREGGGVVLLHDLNRSEDRNAFVLETTALLLEVAARESFHIKPLSELFK